MRTRHPEHPKKALGSESWTLSPSRPRLSLFGRCEVSLESCRVSHCISLLLRQALHLETRHILRNQLLRQCGFSEVLAIARIKMLILISFPAADRGSKVSLNITAPPMVIVLASLSTVTFRKKLKSISIPSCNLPRVVENPWPPPVARKGTLYLEQTLV